MPCTPSPVAALPTPPAGLTLTAPIPAIPKSSVETPCCSLPTLPPIPIPKLLPPLTVNPAFLALLHKGLDAIDAWEAKLLPKCPRS